MLGIPLPKSVAVFYSNQNRKQVDPAYYVSRESASSMKKEGLGAFADHAKSFVLFERTLNRKLLEWFNEQSRELVRGDSIRRDRLAAICEKIGADKFPLAVQGGLTRNEHQPDAKLWQPRKAFKLPYI